MNRLAQIAALLAIAFFAFHCSSTKSAGEKSTPRLSGTYKISKLIIPKENITLNTRDAESTFHNIVEQLKESDPDFELDSAKVRQQVELDLISIGAFRMHFHKDGTYNQSEFFYNNTTAPPFSGFFIVDKKNLVLMNSQSDVYDTYEVVNRSEGQLTLQKYSENNSSVLFIMVMERAGK
ncbi:hypothetical protein [Halocola ammonii]